MQRSEQPAQHTPPKKPHRMQAAGLYGEVEALPVSRRGPPAPLHEVKTFL